MDWQKLSPDEQAWEGAGPVSLKVITTQPSRLHQVKLADGALLPNPEAGNQLILVSAGGLCLDDGRELEAGDLLWMPVTNPVAVKSQQETVIYELELPADIGGNETAVISSAQIPWQQFEDPAARPTQPVQLLLDAHGLSVLRTRFMPEYSAGEHWHDFDTWYFITDGDMRFGHEGTYHTGQVRQVSGGYSYGPEEPGSQGVEFVLVSVGGPVALHWADLEAAPHGALQPHAT